MCNQLNLSCTVHCVCICLYYVIHCNVVQCCVFRASMLMLIASVDCAFVRAVDICRTFLFLVLLYRVYVCLRV